jgi:glycosyltransferase involved in cell wall biosynthesis
MADTPTPAAGVVVVDLNAESKVSEETEGGAAAAPAAPAAAMAADDEGDTDEDNGGDKVGPMESDDDEEEEDYEDDNGSVIVTPHGREYKALKTAKKVLIVTPAYPPNISFGGGVAITYDALCRRLKKRGAEVTVLSPQCGNLDGITAYMYPGFKLEAPSFANLQRIWHCVGEADVVVVPDGMLAQFVIFIGRLKHTPVINNVHTNVKLLLQAATGKYNPIPLLVDFFLALNTWLATVAYTTSPSYAKVLRKRGYRVVGSFSPRIKTQIFNEYDSPEVIAEARQWLTKGQPDKPLMIYAGRWSEEKRIHLLAAAKPEGAICAIVGDGPLSEKIKALHDEKAGFHVFQGMLTQERLRVLYKASDLLVSASNFETLGMTVFEAHLCGTPAVVQDATGFDTQIVKEKNGYLVDYADSAAAKSLLADVLRRPPSRREVLRTTTHKGWDAQLPQLDEVVDKVAGFRVGSKMEWPTIVLFFLWLVVVYITLSLSTLVGLLTLAKAEQEVRPPRKKRNWRLRLRRNKHGKGANKPASPRVT